METQVNKGGRPRHEPTEETRKQVSDLAGGGMSHEGIAITLGVARQTLETYYPAELSTGAYRVRAEVLGAMLEAAKKGSVAAAKLYLQNEPQFALPQDVPAEAKPVEEKPVEKLGKKEQANKDAETAMKGTVWETLLPTHSLQ